MESSISEDVNTANNQAINTSNGTPSFLRSFSTSSNGNDSVFGDKTVAKLDMLLHHIEDIKKSVDEMDADLHSVEHKMSCRPPPPFMTLVNLTEDESDIVGSGLATLLDDTSPPTPTLEWDSNDIQEAAGLYAEEDLVSSTPVASEAVNEDCRRKSKLLDIAVLKESLHLDLISSHSNLLEDAKDNVPVTLVRTTRSKTPSSGNGSMLSSPEDKHHDRDKALKDMLSEARRLGIVPDLMDALAKTMKRDSAYFED